MLVSQAITRVAQTCTAADLEPEGPTTLVISWKHEPGTALGPAWVSELAHQIRRLGGRWETQCAIDPEGDHQLVLRLESPLACARLLRVPRATGIQFPPVSHAVAVALHVA